MQQFIRMAMMLLLTPLSTTQAWIVTPTTASGHTAAFRHSSATLSFRRPTALNADTTTTTPPAAAAAKAPEVYDYTVPEEAVVILKPAAMKRLRELRHSQLKDPANDKLVLRMGVRSGGCSGMSYVMDFSTEESIQEDDAVDEYVEDKILCVVDAKSMLYLYGLQLDYSTELIGGGFKFFNPNAEESCGCGSSFGV